MEIIYFCIYFICKAANEKDEKIKELKKSLEEVPINLDLLFKISFNFIVLDFVVVQKY